MSIEELYTRFKAGNGVCTDTRNIVKGSIFFALRGARFNGNTFAAQALSEGSNYAVIDEDPEQWDDRFIRVDSALETLQKLATHHRRQFSIPVIALTGSNGKTTSKELMAAALAPVFRVHATRGNLNNHIGVPLTLLAMGHDAEIAIIEMGANQPNDIGELCAIAEPDFGIITNIGSAHLEGFGGKEGVRKAKGQMYDYHRTHKGKLFVHCNDATLMQMSEGMERITYATRMHDEASVCGQSEGSGLCMAFRWSSNDFSSDIIQTQLSGAYNVPNFMLAVCVAHYFDVPGKTICDALANYTPDNNRSQVVRAGSNTLIMDAYNANPTSTEAALQELARTSTPLSKMCILGDMLELGDDEETEHIRIAQLVRTLGLEGVFVGSAFCHAIEKAALPFPAFEDNKKAGSYLDTNRPVGKLILVKGSRGIQLEGLVPLLGA
ncbi:MAG: UDP-N-acetylmuramoyl-tripeptide--D-alanyl-D-alanine ligase [Cryomorphaceae bacterium]|nr:MAG: UDP-N-acetylmuramoyl-tripeptide--D-alanyl-D-alanine ligase [Cryomorphaceae bacterium]